MNSDFKELLTILNGCRVSYLIVGGYAYIHYAEPRYTKDIDLWIDPTPENAVRLRDALVQFGGWVDGMTLEHFTTERTMFQIGLPPCRVDFLTSIPGLEFTPAHAARKIADIEGLVVPFISLPDLITAKRTAGREQDLRDLIGLERVLSPHPRKPVRPVDPYRETRGMNAMNDKLRQQLAASLKERSYLANESHFPI